MEFSRESNRSANLFDDTNLRNYLLSPLNTINLFLNSSIFMLKYIGELSTQTIEKKFRDDWFAKIVSNTERFDLQ